MKLKQLTLQGYKTFPVKTDFVFDEGITAIVGPNGSGKSNIADAIRWVLGEQSYSTLRGKRTVDMIFAGSQSRSRSGMAQATLTLDNADNWLPIDYSEVEITRRAFRSGENEYILNGQKVRLRDITELLATSGLSERTYTIIGQGLIDRALSLRSDERRALFEEAAGVNHYKTHRAETLRRLNETQHNLERVQDILAEIKPRLTSLQRQATRTRNHEQISQDLRNLLRIWYGYKWDRARADLRQARQHATRAEKNWKDSRKEALAKQQAIDNLQNQINQAQRKITQLQEQKEIIRDQVEHARRRSAVIHERQGAIREQLADIEQEVPTLKQQKIGAERQLQEAVADLQLSQQRLESQRASLADFRKSFQSQQEEIDRQQKKLKDIAVERNQIQTNLAQNQGKLSQLDERLKENISQLGDQDSEQLAKFVAEGERQLAQLSLANEEIKELRSQRKELQGKRLLLIAELKQKRNQENKDRKDLNLHRERTARLETKTELLDQLRQKDATIDGTVPVIGSLAELLTIPDEYKTAVEAAVSERLAAIIVTDTADLWRLVDGSPKQNITAAALTDVQDHGLHPKPNSNGVINWASELVAAKKEIENIIRLLLGPVLVVQDRETAYSLSLKLPPGTLAVALDGSVAFAGGVFKTHNVEEQNSILLRETAWREAQKSFEDNQKELNSKEDAVLRLQNEIIELQDQVDQIQNEDRQLSRQENESVQKLSVIQRRVDHNEQQQSFIRRQKENRERESHILDKRSKDLKQIIASDTQKARNLDEELTNLQTSLELLPVAETRQQEETLLQVLTSIETIVAGRAAVVDSRRTTLDQVDQQLNRFKQRQEYLREQQDRFEQESLSLNLKALQEEQGQIDEKLIPVRKQIDQQREELFELQNKTAELQRHAHEIETIYTQTQVKLTQQESQIEALQERIHNDLGLVALRYDKDQSGPMPLPITDVFDQLPSVDELPADIEKTIQQYRGQLQRMGSINPDAPAEFEETQERFEFMTQQVEDLNATEEQLRQVISELDVLTSRAFAATVEEVNSVFGETFTQLFGGGSARLVLTDPDDLTVSGVDIIARLPNRREQGLGLLSGGERSLTASALIFALLKVSPTPFCVLDEVDAALDEANINRFRELLRELSLKTQIIVITHNRGTVHAAQTIYGVSMQPDSASQVLSIRPEEYVRQELI